MDRIEVIIVERTGATPDIFQARCFLKAVKIFYNSQLRKFVREININYPFARFLSQNVFIALLHNMFGTGGPKGRCSVMPFYPLSVSRGFSLFRHADFNDKT